MYYGENIDLGAYIYVTILNKDLPRSANDTTPFDKALELSPNDTKILLNKGKYLADKLGKYDEAIIYYDKALKINVNYAPALYNEGKALQKLARYDEAQQYFDKAKKIDPSYGGDFINPSPRLLPSAI